MGARKRGRTTRKAATTAEGGAAPGETVCIVSVNGAGFSRQWVSSADGDEMSEEQADAHKFLLSDAREVVASLDGAELHSIGTTDTVDL